MENNTSSIKEARHKLWRMNNLSYLLDPNQKILYDMYKNNSSKVLVWNLARGSGKSRTLCIIAIEECLKNPKALVKYACAKQKDARQIIQPLIRDLMEDCPDDLKCVYNVAEGAYKFPSGSQLQLAGLDSGRAESLRGGSAVLGIVDEAGMKNLKKELKYIIDSILYPAVTRTKDIDGKIILASTPPTTHDHPFVYYLRVAEIEKAALTRTVYSNPRMSPEMINGIIKQLGGVNSSTFRREYLCEIVINEEDSVVPEFTKDIQAKTVIDWKRPQFFDGYVAMDVGLKDLTVVLFAYYDFLAKKLIIEDEYVLNGTKFTTKHLAENIKLKEAALFTNLLSGEFRPPYKRVSDNNLILIADLYHEHNLTFFATKKDDADAALNNLRVMIAAGEIIINPRCEVLISHLKNATWNKSRKSFDRSVDNGHYDAVDSLKYLVRNIDTSRNPYPANYGALQRGLDHRSDDYFGMGNKNTHKYESLVKSMLNMKRGGNK